MFMLVVTVCATLDSSSCEALVAKQSFLGEPSCKEFALEEYPALLGAYPIVAAMQCLPMPGEVS